MLRGNALQRRQHRTVAQAVRRADSHRASHAHLLPHLWCSPHHIELLERRSHTLQQALTKSGDPHLTRIAVEQQFAKVPLKALYGARDRLGGSPQAHGHLPEAVVLGGHTEDAQ
ncbi:hypothetical protein D3C75_852960 [compost metagenome]